MDLGYHSQNNDLKIFNIGHPFGTCPPTVEGFRFQVYLLSTNLWEQFWPLNVPRGLITYVDGYVPGLFFNGALHFMAASDGHRLILTYDVDDGNFWEIILLQNYDAISFKQLTVLNGSLAWLLFLELGPEHELIQEYHIWVMRVYGNVESWALNIVELEDVEDFYGCTCSDKLVILKSHFPNQLFLFDHVSLDENDIGIGGLEPPRIYIANLIKSLVFFNERN